ncbi:MAG: LysR family transcriptional regulator [Beijerinckiaceae bacterium]|nr:LysR family transcriptional regulator [Beijerinckiaceae bacterium]
MIDRYLIRYFLAVVDQSTFSRAAAHCNVTQPTLSAGVAKLERLLGTALFLRSNQRVQLTDAGSRFLIHSRRIENEFNMAQRVSSKAKEGPILRVGILRSVPTRFASAAVKEIGGRGHAKSLELLDGNERDLASALVRGRIDVALGIVARGGDESFEQPLREEAYSIAMGEAHPLAGRASIDAEDLAEDVMIVRRHCEALSEISRYFTQRGVRPHFALRTTNDDQVMQMIVAGLGITVMPDSFKLDGIVRPRLSGLTLRRTIGLIYGAKATHLRTDPPPFLKALGEAVSQG